MTSIESTMTSQHLNTSNNDEESIYLTSSDDDKDQESVEYAGDEQFEQENNGYEDEASDNDDFAYGNSYEDEEREHQRRPIKVYDEYDPENIDNNEDDSDDDDIPLNMYSQKKKQLEASKQRAESDAAGSSSDDEPSVGRPKKRGRPRRTDDPKSAKKAKSIRKQTSKQDLKKKLCAKKKSQSDSDSASSADSDSKSKQARKNPTKENVNTDLSSKSLVKKTPCHSAKQKSAEGTKLSQAQNIISGRVINFESGFKIPKRPSNESAVEKEPPEKKTKTEDKATVDKAKLKDPKETVKTSKASKPAKSVDKKADKKAQSVKNGFKESVDFLEALSSSSSRKHAHTSKKPILPSGPRVETAKNESSQDKKPDPSLKTNLESSCTSTPCLINRVETVDNTDQTSLLNSHSTSSDSNLLKFSSNGLKSNLTMSGTKKLSKKKVVWADSCSQQLESVQLFYLDESERVIKKEAYRGADMSKVDKLSEKEFTFRITSGHGFGDFNEEEAVSTWPTSLIPIDLPESTITPEIKSEEREIQAKREANTLAVLVFKKFMPDSATEPDAEPASDSLKTKIIPLDETNNAETRLPSEEAKVEQDKIYTPSHEPKPKIPLLSNPVTKTPLLPTPPVQPPSSSTEASGSKKEPINILNMLNLSSSILKSSEDAERLKKILSLVGASPSADSKTDEPKIPDSDHTHTKFNIPKTDTNNNPRWNNNNNNNNNPNWQNHKHSNHTFNRGYNQNSNQGQGRNVFVNNFKRGIGNRTSMSYGHGHNNNYRGNDSRAGFNRQNYAMHGQNRNRFGENKNYEDSERAESKSTQGGRWI